MRRFFLGGILMIPVLVAGAIALFGLIVMLLWNWLMPAIFGLTVITFWQALGLLILSWILLGGIRGARGYRRHGRHRMHGPRSGMSPEERERFREDMKRWGEEMRRRWGGRFVHIHDDDRRW